MLESRLFAPTRLTRLCSTWSLRRHCPSYSAYSSFDSCPISRPLSTSHARFCIYHKDALNSTQRTALNKLFHEMPAELDNRPEVGKGSGHLEETPSKRDDNWQNRPPYRTTDANEKFEKRHTAHCHCGRVKYWLSREKPLASKFCHCVDCQALHGNRHSF